MRFLLAVLLGLGYVAILLGVTPYIEAPWMPWLSALISIAFVLAFTLLANGGAFAALSLVALVTLVLPVTVLTLMGWPYYPSAVDLFGSALQTMREHNALWGLELVLPTVAAGLAIAATKRMRSNTTPHADARDVPASAEGSAARAGGRGR